MTDPTSQIQQLENEICVYSRKTPACVCCRTADQRRGIHQPEKLEILRPDAASPGHPAPKRLGQYDRVAAARVGTSERQQLVH